MAVAFIMDFAEATTAQYDEVMENMALDGHLPEHALFHAIGPKGDGMIACDVWETPEAYQAFAETKIGPLTAAVGLAPPQVRVVEGRQVLRGKPGEVEFMQVVTIPGISDDDFRKLDELIRPGGEVPDALMFHVAGPVEGGWCVVDYWTSKAARDAFLQDNIRPSVEAAGIDAIPTFEEIDVYASLTEPAAVRT